MKISKPRSCLPFMHAYPPRATGKLDRLGFSRLCRKCGKSTRV